MANLDLAAGKILREPAREFHMLSTVSFKKEHGAKSICVNFDNVDIEIKHDVPRKLDISRWSSIRDTIDSPLLPSNYTILYAKILERSDRLAGKKMIEAASLLCAALNLFENRYRFRIVSGFDRRRNQIRFGKIHYVFDENGKPIEHRFYFELDWEEVKFPEKISTRYQERIKYVSKIFKFLRKSAWGDVLKRSMTVYFDALCSNNENYSLIRLWTALEILTNENKSSKDEATIRRTASILKIDGPARDRLEAIKAYRNQYVHEGREGENIEQMIESLRYYYELLFDFVIYINFNFRSHSEFLQFLDVQKDVTRLKRIYSITRKAIRFRRPKSEMVKEK